MSNKDDWDYEDDRDQEDNWNVRPINNGVIEIVTFDDKKKKKEKNDKTVLETIKLGLEKGWNLKKFEKNKRNEFSYTFINDEEDKIINMNLNITDTGKNTYITEHAILDNKRDYESDIVFYREQNKTQNEIAEILGISQSYVSKILKK